MPGRRLHPDGPVLTTIWDAKDNYDDMSLLNNTIFCPQPAGIAGEFLLFYSASEAECCRVSQAGQRIW